MSALQILFYLLTLAFAGTNATTTAVSGNTPTSVTTTAPTNPTATGSTPSSDTSSAVSDAASATAASTGAASSSTASSSSDTQHSLGNGTRLLTALTNGGVTILLNFSYVQQNTGDYAWYLTPGIQTIAWQPCLGGDSLYVPPGTNDIYCFANKTRNVIKHTVNKQTFAFDDLPSDLNPAIIIPEGVTISSGPLAIFEDQLIFQDTQYGIHTLAYPNMTMGTNASSTTSSLTQLKMVDPNNRAILGINGTGDGNWTLQGIPLGRLSDSCTPTPYNFSSLDLVTAVPGFFFTASFKDSSMSVWKIHYDDHDCYTLEWAAKFGYMAPNPLVLAANMVEDPSIAGGPFPRVLWPQDNGWLNSTDYYGNGTFTGFGTPPSYFSNRPVLASTDYRENSPFVAFADQGSDVLTVWGSVRRPIYSLYRSGGGLTIGQALSLAWL